MAGWRQEGKEDENGDKFCVTGEVEWNQVVSQKQMIREKEEVIFSGVIKVVHFPIKAVTYNVKTITIDLSEVFSSSSFTRHLFLEQYIPLSSYDILSFFSQDDHNQYQTKFRSMLLTLITSPVGSFSSNSSSSLKTISYPK